MRNEYVERTSICKVIQEYNGKKWLLRLADIEDGRVTRFIYDEDAPKFFDNRNRLHFKDGPDEIGVIGVWHWTAIPRDTDYEKDYIDSTFIAEIQPIEIIVLPDVYSEKMLVENLKNKVPYVNSGVQVLYCYNMKKIGYLGVLIQDHQLENVDDSMKIREEVVSLPQYKIDFSETLRTEGPHLFLRSLTLPKSNENLLIKPPFEVIKSIILRRSSWAAVKSAGLTKGEYKRLKGYLSEITDISLYEEVSNTCGLSIEEAKSQVGYFLKNIQQYLDRSDLDTQVIESVVESHDVFRKEVESIVEENWLKENEAVIVTAKEEIEKYNKEIEEEKKELQSLYDEIAAAQGELKRIQEEIGAQEKIASDVEQKVLHRITEARDNVAEFITNMAFTAPFYTQARNLVIEKTDNCIKNAINNAECVRYKKGDILEEEKLDHHNKWEEVLITIEDELASAGVDRKQCAGFAAFLFCAWKNHVSVLLAGPNAVDIVNALSSSLFGKFADQIECIGTYTHINVPNESKGQIIVVKNIFQSNWIDHITDILVDEDNYYIFVNPFVEDLAIEPKGLYNYMLPLFTDVLVSEKASHQYYGGKVTGEYVDFNPGAITDKYSKLLSKSTAGKLSIMQLEHVLGDLAKMTGYRQDWDYYYAVMPYMISTGQKEKLVEHIKQENKISRECKETILNYLDAQE